MSNLLKDASILLTPTAYENGRMNAIKPYKDLYGPELVTNGDFSNGSANWVNYTTGSSTIVFTDVATLNVDASNSNVGIYQENVFASGKKYKVVLRMKASSSFDAEVLETQGAATQSTIGSVSLTTSYQDFTFYYTAIGVNDIFIHRKYGSPSANQSITISNISVVEDLSGDFQFSRGSAATRVNAQGLVENVQILSPELVSNGDFSQIGTEEVLNGNFSQEGSEQISNGSFDTDTKWTTNTGWSISGGSANCDGTQSGNTTLVQQNGIKGAIIDFVVGKTYKVNFDIVVTSGVITQLEVASGVDGNDITTSGNYTTYITAVSTNDRFTITANSDFIGSIDNVSVKEVGQNWDFGGDWAVGENKIIHPTGSSPEYVTQDNVLTIGKHYTYSVELLTGNGSNFAQLYVQGVGAIAAFTNGSGVYTGSFTAQGTNIQIRAVNADIDVEVTNISVKEVGQDWTLGTGWSIDQANSKAKSIQTGTNNYLQQTISTLSNNKLYRVTFDLDIISSTTTTIGISNTGAFGQLSFSERFFTTSGTKTFDALYSDAYPNYIRFVGGAGTEFTITNISIKEITDDTDIPRINYSGFSYQDSLGTEEVVNGDFATDSNWNKDNSWTISGGAANYNYISGRNMNSSSAALVVGKTYKLVYTILNYSSGYVTNDSAETRPQRNSNGTYTEVFTARYTFFRFKGSVSGAFSIDNVSVKEVTGQEVVPDSGCGSWLLEPQSTNLTPYSEDFSQSAWVKTGLSIVSNSIASPSGEVNSDKWVEDNSNGSHNLRNNPNLSVTSGGKYTMSIFAKAGERTGLRFANAAESSVEGRFDLSNGTVTFTGVNTTFVGVEDYGNGWYRCIVSFVATTTIAQLNLRLMDGSALSYQGDGTSGLYAWGAQLENLSYATSYIPTNGATNTRLQDIANNSGNSTLINSTEGVFYAEISALESGGVNRYISLSDNTTSNRIQLVLNGSNANRISVSGTGLTAINYDSYNQTDMNKVAFKYSSSGVKLFVNGLEVGSNNDNATWSSGTLTTLDFALWNQSSLPLYGKAKALAVYKEALTDANLRSLTYPNPVATTFDLDFDTIAEQFTFTRGSEATFVNAQGLIQSTNELGAELVNSWTNQDFSSFASNGSNITQMVSSGSGNNCYSPTTITSGKTYKIEFTCSQNITAQIRISNNNNLTSAQVVLSNPISGLNSIIFTANANYTYVGFYAASAFSDTQISGFTLKEHITATNTPRIDYSTGAKAFLLEPQSTNTAIYSEDKAVYSYNDSTIRENVQIITPYGYESKAVKIDAEAGDNSPIRAASFNLGSYSQNDVVTLSGFVKYNGYRYVQFGGYFGNESARFDLQEGVVIANLTNVISSSITAFGNDWYKVVVTYTFQDTIGNGNLYGGWAISPEPDFQFTNAPSGGIYAWGLQAELGTGTSYIPTNGASATRNQELCNNATPVINSEEGTLYAEIAALADDENVYKLLEINNGGTTDRVYIAYRNNSVYVAVVVGGVTQFIKATSTSITSVADFNKIAVKYKENDFALWINGVEVATDAIGITSANGVLNSIDFSNSSNGIPFFGNTKGLKYYPKALADVQLEDLTTI